MRVVEAYRGRLRFVQCQELTESRHSTLSRASYRRRTAAGSEQLTAKVSNLERTQLRRGCSNRCVHLKSSLTRTAVAIGTCERLFVGGY
jgi:hypothetical protein